MSDLQRGNDAYLGASRGGAGTPPPGVQRRERPADALVGCGSACDLLGRHDEALEYVERALSLDGRHASAHHLRGTLLRGRFREGWEEYR
jgi:tetratricopeptide (TPR) repeat protein